MKDFKRPEDIYQETYLNAMNKLCEGCPCVECKFRNKREFLKEQRIDHRKVRCEREASEYIAEGLDRELP